MSLTAWEVMYISGLSTRGRAIRGIFLIVIAFVFLSGCNSDSDRASGADTSLPRTNANATTIAFNGLADNGSPVTEYDESGFNISSKSGNWEVMAGYGKPAPAIVFSREASEPESQGEIEVTDDGAVFGFTSVDLYSSITPIPYTIKGYKGSELVFTMSDRVPNTYGKFARVTNPDVTALIDRLVISLSNPETPCCRNPVGIDNIRFNQEAVPQKTGEPPAPGSGSTVTAASGPAGGLEAEIRFNYHIPTDEEAAAAKMRIMAGEAFRQRAAQIGEEQAESELDAKLKADRDYLIEKNAQGSEKIPVTCVGDDPGCTPLPGP